MLEARDVEVAVLVARDVVGVVEFVGLVPFTGEVEADWKTREAQYD